MAWTIAALSWGVLAYWTAREISRYRKEQSEPYPYTRARIARRCTVSFLIFVEVGLLFVVSGWLSAEHPYWFLAYVLGVVVIVIAMLILAVYDWRESRLQVHEGREKIFAELVMNIRDDSPNRPEIH